MKLEDAYQILDIDSKADLGMIKANYKWLIKLYHPDNGFVKSSDELRKIIEAYKSILK